METTIILVRHGESEWNSDSIHDRYNGLTDTLLNEYGLRQASLIGRFLKNTEIEAFYCSPLKRSIMTAQSVLEFHPAKELIICKELEEINFGEWEGHTRHELSLKYGDLYKLWEKNPDQTYPPGGESGEDVSNRIMPLINNLSIRHCGKIIFIAAHKNVNRVLLAKLMGIHLSLYRSYIPQRVGAMNIFNMCDWKLVKVERIDDLSYTGER